MFLRQPVHPRRLADLYNHNSNKPRAVQEQAHSVVDAIAEHNERLFDLESQWNDTDSVGETLAPSWVATTTQSLLATDTLLQQLVHHVAALLARPVATLVAAVQSPQNTSSGNGSSTTNSRHTLKPWR